MSRQTVGTTRPLKYVAHDRNIYAAVVAIIVGLAFDLDEGLDQGQGVQGRIVVEALKTFERRKNGHMSRIEQTRHRILKKNKKTSSQPHEKDMNTLVNQLESKRVDMRAFARNERNECVLANADCKTVLPLIDTKSVNVVIIDPPLPVRCSDAQQLD